MEDSDLGLNTPCQMLCLITGISEVDQKDGVKKAGQREWNGWQEVEGGQGRESNWRRWRGGTRVMVRVNLR